jgi:hypothetical protein
LASTSQTYVQMQQVIIRISQGIACYMKNYSYLNEQWMTHFALETLHAQSYIMQKHLGTIAVISKIGQGEQ